MILILCVDEKEGRMFNHRRQSQDRALREDVCRLAVGQRLWMNAYSRKQFKEPEDFFICVSENFLEQAEPGEYCFVEDADLSGYTGCAEAIVLYRWNRRYPADCYLDPELLRGLCLVETKDFSGFSHETITREIWK